MWDLEKYGGGKGRTGKRRTKFAWVENAGLENTGTSCVWVARRNMINVVCVRDAEPEPVEPLGWGRNRSQNRLKITGSGSGTIDEMQK